MRRFLTTKTNLLLTMLLTFSLVISAFGHQASASSIDTVSASTEASQYLLPGETLASFCLNPSDNENHQNGNLCDFCILGHSMLVNECALPDAVNFQRDPNNQLPIEQAFYRNCFRPWAPGHAPPFTS